jgi:hypothetical protein
MLGAFIRNTRQPKRLAVLSDPTHVCHKLIRSLWASDHSVFPILPNKYDYLSHLLTEGRCDGLLVSSTVAEQVSEAAHIAGKCLGVPVIPFSSENVDTFSDSSGNVILEGVSSFSTVPCAVSIKRSSWYSHVDRNKQYMNLSPDTTVMSVSRNWVFDAESFNFSYPDLSKQITPQVVILDPVSMPEFHESIKRQQVHTQNIERIIVDAPLSYEASSIFTEETEDRLSNICRSIFIRYIVPEVGPLGPPIPLEQLKERGLDSIPDFLDGEFDSKIENDKLLVRAVESFEYVGRQASTSSSFQDGIYFPFTLVPLKPPVGASSEQRVKRRIMMPDWRVRKVPIAVYNKKRGFKGQIYYTTKHKGWSFYRSRYYN